MTNPLERRSTRRALCVAILGVTALAGCGPSATPPPAPTDVHAVQVAKLPASPADAAWGGAPTFAAPLILQDMVEPRKMKPGVTEVRVQALTDGRAIAFRLAWADATQDSLRCQTLFTDACAVQLPAAGGPDLPAPQMGEQGRPVEISYWSAAAQAVVDGRPDDLKVLYPNMQIDHYPFAAAPLDGNPAARDQLAAQYAPARALGNVSGVPPKKPVQDLVATGPGTIATAPVALSDGQGKWTNPGWAVVISRPLPKGIALGAHTQVAFAVWNGSNQDVGARKMRTVWVPLIVGGPGRVQ